MNRFSILPLFLLSTVISASEPPALFFEQENAKEYTRIAFTIHGDQMTGTQHRLPKQPDGHAAYGTISGSITGGGIIQVLYEYSIEDSDLTEEEVLKLDGDKLFIGEGPLKGDPNDSSRLNLEEPDKVVFKRTLTKIPSFEPKAGTPEREAIMDAMRAPMSVEVGQDVDFTGTVRVSGSWARFSGHVDAKEGKPKNEDIAAKMKGDFSALLQKEGKGGWKVVQHGFGSDIDVGEAAKEKYPKAPWVLFDWYWVL